MKSKSLMLLLTSVAWLAAVQAAAPGEKVIDHVSRRVVKIFGAGGIRGLHAYSTGFLVSPQGHLVTVWSHVLIDQSVTVSGKTIRMEFLRSVFYSDRTLASVTTGQFHVTERGSRLHIRIQLQDAIEAGRRATIQARFSSLFNAHVPAVVRVVPYFDFRDALSVDYERKFHHRMREA